MGPLPASPPQRTIVLRLLEGALLLRGRPLCFGKSVSADFTSATESSLVRWAEAVGGGP